VLDYYNDSIMPLFNAFDPLAIVNEDSTYDDFEEQYRSYEDLELADKSYIYQCYQPALQKIGLDEDIELLKEKDNSIVL
jgi:hypothetical protein